MINSRYHFRYDTFICLAGRYYVILDLLRDKYLCIPKDELELLRPHLELPVGSQAMERTNSDGASADPTNLLDELIKDGLVTLHPQTGSVVSKPCRPTTTELNDELPGVTLRACLRFLPAFLYSAIASDRALKQDPITNTAQRVAERKRQLKRHSTPHYSSRQLIAVFNRLRPLYPRKYLCLFDSLALLKFLSLYQIFPDWVFAVQSEPFRAHCWVQQDEVLLNETVERASLYTQVLTI